MFSDKVMAFKVSNGNQDMHTVLLVLKSGCFFLLIAFKNVVKSLTNTVHICMN